MPRMPSIELKNVQSVSLLAGTKICDARCPFCVAELTPTHGLSNREVEIPIPRLRDILEYGRQGNAKTLMITGKGEPTLFPEHITKFLEETREFEEKTGFKFQKKELQSNGIRVAHYPEKYHAYLDRWKTLGLQTFIVSIVHYDPEENRKNYVPYLNSYIDLDKTVQTLHQHGLAVRLGCIAYNGGIDSREKLVKLINLTMRIGADELTVRSVATSDTTQSAGVHQWIKEHELTPEQHNDMYQFLEQEGLILTRYPFGGTIYRLGSGTSGKVIENTRFLS